MVHFVKKEKEKSQSTLKFAICHHTYPIFLWLLQKNILLSYGVASAAVGTMVSGD